MSVKYSRRRRLLIMYTLLLASILLLSTTTALLVASEHIHRGQLVRIQRREETTLGPTGSSSLCPRSRLKRYEIHGRWKELHISLGLKLLPDAPFHPEPFTIEAAEINEETTLDTKDQLGSRRKRDFAERPHDSSRSQPILFLADDSQHSPTESLDHLRRSFKVLARRHQVEKSRRRLGDHLMPIPPY